MDSELLAFCHLGKTGGTSVNAMLQKSYGIRHLDVFSPKGGPYTPDEMKFDLRIHPTRPQSCWSRSATVC